MITSQNPGSQCSSLTQTCARVELEISSVLAISDMS